MNIDLTDTDSAAVAEALRQARRRAGSPAMGMVLTLVVVAEESTSYDALRAATRASTEHPARILGVIRRPGRGAPRLDAEVHVGDGMTGEAVVVRLSGQLAHHAESVVVPLLLPDSPVVSWWAGSPPADPATDPLGALAQRRVTDAATTRRTSEALRAQAEHYVPGNTDLTWTRLTPWRALLAAAVEQHPEPIRSGEVAGERGNASADLLAAWLGSRLDVEVTRTRSRGPGITDVRLVGDTGKIELTRPDGRLALLSVPGQPDRPVALRRRETPELLSEELRRLDPDEVYADALAAFLARQPVGASERSSTR